MKLNYDWINNPQVTPENREDYIRWFHAAVYVRIYRKRGVTGPILDNAVAKSRAARQRFAGDTGVITLEQQGLR